MKVTVTQNTTQIPFVNGTLMQESYCKDEVVDMWIRSVDGEELEVTIRHDKTNFYVEQLSVRLTSSDTANIGEWRVILTRGQVHALTFDDILI